MTTTDHLQALAPEDAPSPPARSSMSALIPANSDLAALRQVLLAPEQATLRQILSRLDDPATRATEIADILPSALALASVNAEAFAATLRPLVRESLLQVLKEQPHLLGSPRCISPLRSFARAIWRPFRRRQQQAIVEHLFLVRRTDGSLLQSAARAVSPDDDTPRIKHDQRNALALVTSLLSILRDPAMAARYAALRYLRVENRLYGIHLADDLLLVSIIGLPHPAADIPEAQLVAFDELVRSPEPTLPQL